MSEFEPPKIEFPCDYPIKVIGEHDQDAASSIIEVVRRHAPEVSRLDPAEKAIFNPSGSP